MGHYGRHEEYCVTPGRAQSDAPPRRQVRRHQASCLSGASYRPVRHDDSGLTWRLSALRKSIKRGAAVSPVRDVGRSPRVKDVAQRAGVSVATVSNVLNKPGRVASETRDRVEAAMAELGFVRNESARHLRAGRSRTVAFVASDAANPFFAQIASGVEDVVEQEDLSLFTCNSRQELGRQAAYLSRLEQQRVLGVLITPVAGRDNLMDTLPARGTPVVVLDDSSSGSLHCSVSVDDRLGGRLAADHLAELGHIRVAFVGPQGFRQVSERREGFETALSTLSDGTPSITDVVTDGLTVANGRSAAKRIADLPESVRPTAAFCANDLLAIGLIRGCADVNLSVPGELAVVGYDDIEFAETAGVPLTSIAGPSRELGRAAARLLLDESANPEHQHQRVKFMPQLIVRSSSC
ncbi:LacI family DNA-binding transcriptional regulator [Streptomyces rubrogriseus]|uniref:LacI family DNA-binding transcriptional regulator n=1 Tax=Streptomyces rubrogriseus TaxID=194673 RepID=UPI003829CBB5